jgi:hypothetical protein
VRSALRLPESNALRLPAIFLTPGEDATCAFALTPSLVNLPTIGDAIVLLRPFGPRRDPADDATDVLLAAARSALRHAGGTSHFLDGWDALTGTTAAPDAASMSGGNSRSAGRARGAQPNTLRARL